MEPISGHSGIAAPFPMSDVNTDLIYPQQFLRKPDRNAMAPFLFHSLRYRSDGTPNPDFILNKEPYDEATILIAGRNFGSGSSREHAPWALKSFGIRCLISSMFADIFKANCINNGIVPATISEEALAECLRAAANPQEAHFTVDLERRELRNRRLGTVPFEISDSDRDRLLKGNDFIDDTLAELPAIENHEKASAEAVPWLNLGSPVK
ncbi:3-isopropylmalate dehydratase small subunit [Mesorhizobium sp. BR1-1-13]|uniref:3-isopropylmalate dehydratase small subunit n=1 Tax=Mesorhizobium sp. BR1-1-13 TaxID=2876656 RepID=UPI001CD13116|nr:3-isopropylmalate dehydratase small subunit [Mesorhizobium sp. BR1-1-13]MBZ9942991.1 3-isopropylmalate dehydratase small subunit [Mesorhizobium sp. BR1-1-13]